MHAVLDWPMIGTLKSQWQDWVVQVRVFFPSQNVSRDEKSLRFCSPVRAFDPNVEESVTHPNIYFKKIGLSNENGTLKNTAADGTVRRMPVLSLLDSIKLFGDEGKEITYLKIDVEGAEFGALPEMLKSGVFEQVRQMGIEMHTGSRNLPKEKNILKALNNSMKVFQAMQETYGFRLIAYNANGCMAKKYCLTRSYHNYHDIVFYKP